MTIILPLNDYSLKSELWGSEEKMASDENATMGWFYYRYSTQVKTLTKKLEKIENIDKNKNK